MRTVKMLASQLMITTKSRSIIAFLVEKEQMHNYDSQPRAMEQL
jgi:hypothetical protein